MVVLSRDGHRAYTANVGAGTVTVVDVPGRKLIKVIPVAETVQRISISEDGRFVFTADQKSPRLAVIDTATNQVSSWIALPAIGYGTATTPDGKWLLVTLQTANQVAVVDLAQDEGGSHHSGRRGSGTDSGRILPLPTSPAVETEKLRC